MPQARVPIDPNDPLRNLPLQLTKALERALAAFPEEILQRDANALIGDKRRQRIHAEQIKTLLKRLETQDVFDALSTPLVDAYEIGFTRELEEEGRAAAGRVAFEIDRDRLKALGEAFIKPLQKNLPKMRSPLPFIESRLLGGDERQEMLALVSEGVARGFNTAQMAKHLHDNLPASRRLLRGEFQKGIWYESAGGRMRYGRYAEMLARTVTYWAANRGTLDRAREAGVGLVKVISNPGTVDFCLDLEGKIYALTSAAASKWGVPLLADTPNGGPPFHPNCRHSIGPFVPRQSEAGKLPTAPEDVLTRDQVGNGPGAQARAAEAAFQERLKRDPKQYAEVIAESAARRGFGNETVEVPEELRGEKIPGIVAQKKGTEKRFQDRGFAEDVSLALLAKDGAIASRKQLRGVVANTLRAAKDRAKVVGEELVYKADGWTVRVSVKTGQVVAVEPR